MKIRQRTEVAPGLPEKRNTTGVNVVRLPGSETGWRSLVNDKLEARLVAPRDAVRGAFQFGRGGAIGVTWVDGPHSRMSDSPFEKPKIFVHGAGGNPRNFDKMIAALRAAGHTNIAVVKFSLLREPVTRELDPGAAQSILESIQSAAADFQVRGHSSATIVGHSYGAVLALYAAHENRAAWSDILAVGGFLDNFGDPGPGASAVIGGLTGVAKLFHLGLLEKNLAFGQRAEVQALLRNPASIDGTRLTTISSENDEFVSPATATRADAVSNYVLPDESHIGLPNSARVIDEAVRLLSTPPASSAP